MKRKTENKKIQVESMFSFDPGVVSDYYTNGHKAGTAIPAWR